MAQAKWSKRVGKVSYRKSEADIFVRNIKRFFLRHEAIIASSGHSLPFSFRVSGCPYIFNIICSFDEETHSYDYSLSVLKSNYEFGYSYIIESTKTVDGYNIESLVEDARFQKFLIETFGGIKTETHSNTKRKM